MNPGSLGDPPGRPPGERDLTGVPHGRNRRKREVRPRTEQLHRLPKKAKRTLRVLNEEAESEGLPHRPLTRGGCSGVQRPCPFVSCSMNLFLEVSRVGNIVYRTPDLEPDQVPANRSCALDVADGGPSTLEEVGEVFNVTRERLRQMEDLALASFLAKLSPRDREEFREAVREALNRPGTSNPLGDIREDSGEGEGFKSVTRRSDALGLSRADEWEVERFTNEVVCMVLREGRSLRDAQDLANGHPVGDYRLPEVEGPEDRPRGILGAATEVEETEMNWKTNPEIQERRVRVTEFLRQRGPSTTRAVADATGMEVGTGQATHFLQEMESEGLVGSSREGRGAITWAVPGDERRPAPAEPPPAREPRVSLDPVAKVAVNSTYGTGQDPAALIRARREALVVERAAALASLDDYDAKIRKLDAALAALE